MPKVKQDETIEEVVLKDEAIALDRPKSAYELSRSLKKVIVENNLFTDIKGKNYVNVEGWQLAGALTGIFPKVKSVERIATDTEEIKYRAEVNLFNIKDGKTIGYGVAFCSNAEYSKRNFDEYAIASMAQTRAVSKAFRLTLGWLMKLAGYEATPADEMAEVAAKQEAQAPQPANNMTTKEKVAQISKELEDRSILKGSSEVTHKQLTWLKTYYAKYGGMTLEDAEAKAKTFRTFEDAKAEIVKLMGKLPENDAK